MLFNVPCGPMLSAAKQVATIKQARKRAAQIDQLKAMPQKKGMFVSTTTTTTPATPTPTPTTATTTTTTVCVWLLCSIDNDDKSRV